MDDLAGKGKTAILRLFYKKRRKNNMKLYINEKNRKGHIEPEIYGHFSEHLAAVFMREFMWERILQFQIKMV